MNQRLLKPISAVLAASLIHSVVMPLVAYALTGGPTQPDFVGFEPVGTTGMVNEFTGSFTYNLPVLNIPGPDGSGYAMSLSYHSGASAEEDASWVGYGWSLNPGAIIRNTRGFPDDYNGEDVTYWNKVPKNWTLTAGARVATDVFSIDGLPITAGASLAGRYNNYKGFGLSVTWDFSYKGLASLQLGLSDDGWSFEPSLNPAQYLYNLNYSAAKKAGTLRELKMTTEFNRQLYSAASSFGLQTFSDLVRPTAVTGYSGFATNVFFGGQGDPTPLPAGVEGAVFGSYAEQVPTATSLVDVFGYMYSGNATEEGMMDYFVEKNSPYSERDVFLGIPFSNADYFTATGEGVGGSFRLYSKGTAEFRPNTNRSSILISQAGVSIHAGGDAGGNYQIGVGEQSLSVGKWSPNPYSFPKTSDGADEPMAFRFTGDLGGNVEYASTDAAARASIDDHTVPGVSTSVNNGTRPRRSSYIGYHTNREMMDSTVTWVQNRDRYRVFYNAYSKDDSARKHVERSTSTSAIDNGIGEIAVYGQEGRRYVYGLPVFSRNEKTLSFGLSNVPPGNVQNLHHAHVAIDKNKHDVVLGEERNAPYASSFLLTEITTPDYIDRTNNGPTVDDFGGYTRFNYRRAAGAANKNQAGSGDWYSWRMPYTGLLFDRNNLSTPEDDIGTVQSGEREMYYLETVETKTHIAVFVTNGTMSVRGQTFSGSGDSRLDAYEANHNAITAMSNPNAFPTESNRCKRLERIELWSKNASGGFDKLIQTVQLRYDYRLCKGLPNSAVPSGETQRAGKLTLVKVWFEYGGISNQRVSPYVFGYEYRDNSFYPTEIHRDYDTLVYKNLLNYGDQYSGTQENPEYTFANLDRWGNYQYGGAARHAKLNPWVNQNPSPLFDPAAWQLKTIQLPSGGEIQVHYEQNEYAYVQDKPAMAMVSLVENPAFTGDDRHKKFLLNHQDLGITTNRGIDSLQKLLKKRFVDDKEKIYFRFLYSLDGSNPSPSACGSEYITGYCTVADIPTVDTTVSSPRVLIVLGSSNAGDYDLPIEVCKDYMDNAIAIDVGSGALCDRDQAGIANTGDIPSMVTSLAAKIVKPFFDLTGVGDLMDYPNSYLRIPMIRAKKGGGIRVKRIMMYDKGNETGDAHLYGTEYLYETAERTSSGVATNEPSHGREENALIQYLQKRTDQSWLQRIIAGRDREQFEGPIGENILPGASVGYSRVVTRNIYAGKTSPGFSISEFHTAKDYPSDMTYTGPHITGDGNANTQIDTDRDWIVVPGGVFNYSNKNLELTQGYRFILTDMHGKPKRSASYGGEYGDRASWFPSSSQEYMYFEPGEKIPMVYDVNDIRLEHAGREMEVVSESREVEDITADVSLEMDGVFSLIAPAPIFLGSVFPGVSFGRSVLRTYVTSKTIRYPAIVKRVVATADGVSNTTEYVGFSRETGAPVLVKTSDGYHTLALDQSPTGHTGTYYNHLFPASEQYNRMSQKGLGERFKIRTFISPTEIGDSIIIEKRTVGSAHYLNLQFLKPGLAESVFGAVSVGDLIQLTYAKEPQGAQSSDPQIKGTLAGIYHIKSIENNKLWLAPVSFNHAPGRPMDLVNLEILQSGRTNQLSSPAGTITTYGAPQTPEECDP